MHEMVDDEEKFRRVNVSDGKDYNFMVKEKKIVDDFLTMLQEKNSIDDKQKEELTPDGPNPAWLYGLPKVHKPLVGGLPKYRPIMSQIGSTTYKIAKFLLTFIRYLSLCVNVGGQKSSVLYGKPRRRFALYKYTFGGDG